MDTFSISSALFNVGITLLTVSLAAILARETYFRQERCRLLVQAYSDFFTAYMNWVIESNSRNSGVLLAALQRARMLCSENTDKLFVDFTTALREQNRSEQGRVLTELRKACRQEIDDVMDRRRHQGR